MAFTLGLMALFMRETGVKTRSTVLVIICGKMADNIMELGKII